MLWRGKGARGIAYFRGETSTNPRVPERLYNPEDLPEDEFRKRILAIRTVRQGQPQFRLKLMDAYGSKCAVTQCEIRPLLEAAHIIPHKDQGKSSFHVQNGLLLRADIHTLFDCQLIAFRPTNDGVRIEISESLRDTEYGEYDGRTLRIPAYADQFPNAQALEIRLKRLPLVASLDL